MLREGERGPDWIGPHGEKKDEKTQNKKKKASREAPFNGTPLAFHAV